jgi:elongator complex protein 2
MATADSAKRVISSLAFTGESLLCGFSNGSITSWHNDCGAELCWKEHPIFVTDTGRAITHLNGHYFKDEKLWIVVTCSSDGAHLLRFTEASPSLVSALVVASFATNVVRVQAMPFGTVLVLIGTAAPRHNKIHVYMINTSDSSLLHHCGSLTGHEDWITCLAWNPSQTLLASGSQDSKIRLWEFTTSADVLDGTLPIATDDGESSDGEVDDLLDDEDDEVGEARLELCHEQGVTRVTLEALLFGHEEAVTSVHWHPNPIGTYRQENILISSSMDRAILIWSPFTGVWTPLTRVGSAGGILGGSIGSTLLGFVNAAVEPVTGMSLLGHAYGGALHVWSAEQDLDTEANDLSLEDLALRIKWKAMPCVTGHFGAVTDLAWEAECGDYLLTVSADQTCRLWAPLPDVDQGVDVWVEMARPQVHGYDLSAVTSVSTAKHVHLFVSGADEKEIRVFDAPMSTVRLLVAACGFDDGQMEKETSRVERAYIPSLGLSQKASAADGAEVDTTDFDTTVVKSQLRLPLERDLGAVSLWPEMRKLYGHNTELFCLASTVSARSGQKFASSPFAKDILVASSSKARDVKDAAIRLWDVENGKCVQTLSVRIYCYFFSLSRPIINSYLVTISTCRLCSKSKGGHRSTVAALCFSPDGAYLVRTRTRFPSLGNAPCPNVPTYFLKGVFW